MYPAPPIVEALVQFRLIAAESGAELLDAMPPAFVAAYPGDRLDKEKFEIEAAVSKNELKTSAKRAPHVTFLRSADNLRLVGLGDQLLSVSVLAPYPGWESLLEQTQEAVDALPEHVRRSGASRIGVRYIDRIHLPQAAGDQLSTYISIATPYPRPFPENLTGFMHRVQLQDPSGGTTAQLTIASLPSEDGRPTVLYDLDVFRVFESPIALMEGEWLSVVDSLHSRQREIFEASITDRLRRLFQ